MAASIGSRFRRMRRQYLSGPRLRQQAVFWGGGALIGLMAVAFAALADWAYQVLKLVVDWSPWPMLVISPLGFGFLAYLTVRFFDGAQGSGIPQVIAALETDLPERRRALLSLRIAGGKIVITVLGLLFGASIGREGPTVQVGAAIMHELGRLGGRHYDGLLLAGGAAALSAAFNTPIAGIVFAIEELSRSFRQRNSGLVLICVVIGGLVSLALVGNYTYFGTTNLPPATWTMWAPVLVCGVLGGLVGGTFSRIVILFAFSDRRPGLFRVTRHRVLFAAGCGLLVAVLGVLTGGDTYGTGYEQARGLLEGTGQTDPWFGVAKFAATLVSSISGLPGGIFSPSLAAGAGLGHQVGWMFPGIPASAVVLLGMIGYFTGVVQAPITAVVIVLEMTGAAALTLPLMSTALIALAVSKLVCPQSIYHALSGRFVNSAR